MLSKFLAKPLELEIDNKIIKFSSVDDFEFSLDARTAVSSERVTEMFSASSNELNDELKSIGVAKFELSRLVSESPDVSSGIDMRLESIDTAIFSKEHRWRDIFIALNGYDTLDLSKYKNITLKKYLKYLNNRSSIANNIKSTLGIKRNAPVQKGDTTEITRVVSIPNNLSTIESPADILNSKSDLIRISKAKSVTLQITEGTAIDIYLSNYKCKLFYKNGIKFIDADNIEHELELGENKIGCGKECNIKLNQGMREISRLHLLIVIHDHKKIELTDLSVHGTYLSQ